MKQIDLKYAKLNLIKTDKFKSINIKVVLKDKIKKEDITFRNFLTDYLVYTTNKYKTKQELSLKIQELYSLYVNSYNTRIGSYLVTNFNMSLLDTRYTEDGMLEESLDLLKEIIFNPNKKNNKFVKKPFDIIKKGIQRDINTIKENPKIYATIRLFENMNDDKPYSYHGFGYQEDLDKITEKNLYEYYQNFIKTCDVSIYVIGNFNEKEMINLIKEKLDFKTLKKEKGSVYINHDKIRNKVQEIREHAMFKQSKLVVALKLKDLTEFERKYVINLYSMILGGGFNSKLVQTIREKNSLAYYVSSNVLKPDNMLLIKSEISKDNYEKVYNYIVKVLKDIKKGNVSQEELDVARLEYLGVLDEVYDDIDSILENYVATDLLNLDSFETRRDMIKQVKCDDIIKISEKIYLDTVYLLEGDEDEKN